MKKVDGFLAIGVPALLGLIAVLVWQSYRANAVSSRMALDADATVVQRRPHRWRQSQVITADDLRGGIPGLKTYYAYGELLPEGYRCASSQGLVYRTYEAGGATVIEPLIVAGVHVRCGGDERSSFRRR